jgi:hypothetical protein
MQESPQPPGIILDRGGYFKVRQSKDGHCPRKETIQGNIRSMAPVKERSRMYLLLGPPEASWVAGFGSVIFPEVQDWKKPPSSRET